MHVCVFVCAIQVWDYELERSAEHWAHTCRWEHGPSHMLTQIGQNLGAHWGRYVFAMKWTEVNVYMRMIPFSSIESIICHISVIQDTFF